jgi:hypothetical protein
MRSMESRVGEKDFSACRMTSEVILNDHAFARTLFLRRHRLYFELIAFFSTHPFSEDYYFRTHLHLALKGKVFFCGSHRVEGRKGGETNMKFI